MKFPKYQTINYKAIESGVFAFESKDDKPNDTIPLPKCIRLELPIKPSAVKLFLCSPFEKVKVNGTDGSRTGGKKITGLFDTMKDGMWSGDIKEQNGKKSTILCDFTPFGNTNPFEANNVKIYYFFYYYVVPLKINELVYTMFMQRQKQGYSF